MNASELAEALGEVLRNEAVAAMLEAQMAADEGFRVAVETLDAERLDTTLTLCLGVCAASFAKCAVGCWQAPR